MYIYIYICIGLGVNPASAAACNPHRASLYHPGEGADSRKADLKVPCAPK